MRRKQQLSLIIALLIILVLIQIFTVVKVTTNALTSNAVKDLSSEFEKAAEKATPAVVFIVASDKSGSGIIISKDGYVLTNYHVIQENATISVRLPDKRIFSAKLIGSDSKVDIAVLKIEAKDLPTINLGNSDNVQVGQKVLAIGNPYGFDFTVTTGIISAKHRDTGPTEYKDFLQTDASINPGNSGGPLINTNGKVVGINNFKIRGESLGFALESNYIIKAVNAIATKNLNKEIL